ncbi:MAG: 2'-5' RNA ligase family protein [Anaerolineales bacterium]|nr:2'-5' RNA ligase family protein [Anaerolineales bacterium]
MHGLVSVLDEAHFAQVHALWAELEKACGLNGIHVTPIPHFSYQIASDYDWAGLQVVMEELAAQTQPFQVNTTGLALFTGQRIVAYLPVVRTAALSRLHQQIWERVRPLSVAPNPYYDPDLWMPHISLAYQDVTPERLACLMNCLAGRSFDWQIKIDNLTLIYEPDGSIGSIRFQYPFGA